MLYIALDTNIWIYIAEGEHPDITEFIIEKIQANQIEIVTDEVIITEWNRHKEKARERGIKRVKEQITGSLGSTKSIRKSLNELDRQSYDGLVQKFRDTETDLNGLGVEQNIHKTEELWLKGAKSGNDKCQMNLVTLYKSEDFHKIDYSQAAHYCQLAAENGNQKACELLPLIKILERRLFSRNLETTNDSKQENKVTSFEKFKQWFK